MHPVKQDYSVPLLEKRVSEGTKNICCPKAVLKVYTKPFSTFSQYGKDVPKE